MPRMRRHIMVLALVASAPACAAVLGVDDVAYVDGGGPATDAGGGDVLTDTAPPPDGAHSDGTPTDAAADAGWRCDGIDAAVCADFEEEETTYAYTYGQKKAPFTPNSGNGCTVDFGPGIRSPKGLALFTPGADGGSVCSPNEVWDDHTTSSIYNHLRVEMDVMVSVDATSVEGALGLLVVELADKGCSFTYEFGGKTAHVTNACGGSNLDFPSAPTQNSPAHFIFDATRNGTAVAIHAQLDNSNRDGSVVLTDSIRPRVKLGGSLSRTPLPDSYVTIDNVVIIEE